MYSRYKLETKTTIDSPWKVLDYKKTSDDLIARCEKLNAKVDKSKSGFWQRSRVMGMDEYSGNWIRIHPPMKENK